MAIDYGLDIKQHALDKTTDADLGRLKRERSDRIRESGKRSGLQKLLSAAARGGLAYATGGASEALGFGGAVDRAMLGTDSEGRGVRNEFGDLVQAGSGIYYGMKGKKESDIAKKRARNLQEYKSDVDYAVKLGNLDRDQGIMALNKAREKRAAQIAQTGKADKASLWGWDNEYDPLELSSSVVKGKDVADKLVEGEPDRPSIKAGYAPSLEEGGSIQTGRKPRPTYHPSLEDGMTEYESRLNRFDPNRRAELARIEEMYERDRKKAFLENKDLDRQEDPILSDSIKKQRAVDEMMDGEMNKRIAYLRRGGYHDNTGKTNEEFVADYLAGGQKGHDGKKVGPGHIMYTPTKETKSSQTYLDKKPKEDSEKGRVGTLDDIAIDERVKNLKKQDWWDKMFRSDEEEQLLLEDKIKKERALKREHERTGGPYGRVDREGSLFKPFESALKKRIMEERRKKRKRNRARGGILAGGGIE